ncbi:LCP family protein [Proteiniborus sp. MB09-C3]|uniref:LCP family protein n=1 Tax=Proteiniborus sp. MB09-C3 TaxID=3050072 RepID=UPI002552BCC8|nr:LCP family protein [Proteiniborus sp. MB09-C3]WIV13033.1 LCP family protein [Proteiniborus sp. MB09-C3]
MKHFLKIFSIAFICFLLAVGAGVYTYSKIYVPSEEQDDIGQSDKDGDGDNSSKNEEPKDPFQKAIASSKRVNFLLMGMEGPRSDTMIFASYDPKEKKVDMISIPRDTYYYTKGYENADVRKINAVYGRSKTEGSKKAVEEILGQVPVHHYIMIDYKGVEAIVNSIGGVEVDVPFHMEYFDPKDVPPLRIDIPKGKQLLKGEQAVKFLRFRHNNDMTVGYPDGDLGRIRAQQQFLKSAIKKSLSLKIINVVNTAFDHVKTDVKLTEALGYAAGLIGFDADNISMITLPGKDEYRTYNKVKLSYFIHDPDKIKELMMGIYNVQEEVIEENKNND